MVIRNIQYQGNIGQNAGKNYSLRQLTSFEKVAYLHYNIFERHLLTYSMVQSPSWEANWFAPSQEIPRILWNPKVHYCTHKRPPPIPILGQPNPVHITTSHLLEIHPNIIHPSTPRSPQWSLSLRFPHQDPIHPPLLTHTRRMPSPSLGNLHPVLPLMWDQLSYPYKTAHKSIVLYILIFCAEIANLKTITVVMLYCQRH